jgi:hypothetical protein
MPIYSIYPIFNTNELPYYKNYAVKRKLTNCLSTKLVSFLLLNLQNCKIKRR